MTRHSEDIPLERLPDSTSCQKPVFKAAAVTGGPRKKTVLPEIAWGLVLSRKGSRRLPGKATMPLAGRPMASYTFEAIKASSSLSRAYVFSDDSDLLTLAEREGISIPPFRRPAWVSQDRTTTEETLRFFLSQFRPDQLPRLMVLLQVTSPCRVAEDIDSAVRQYLAGGCDYLISVSKPLKPLTWLYERLPENRLHSGFPEGSSLKTEMDRRDWVLPNGAVCIFQPKRLLQGFRLESGQLGAYEMPANRSIDVDTPVELEMAEALIRQRLYRYSDAQENIRPLAAW